MPVPGKGIVKPSLNKTVPLQALSSFNTASIVQPSSTTQPNSHSKVHADSSKKEKVNSLPVSVAVCQVNFSSHKTVLWSLKPERNCIIQT